MPQPSRLSYVVEDTITGLDKLRVFAVDVDPNDLEKKIKRQFIPRRDLQEYLTNQRIRAILNSRNVPSLNVEIIRKDYVAVFGALLRIDRPELITSFLPDDSFADKHLPFREQEGWPQQARDVFQLFSNAQWEFCAQEFEYGSLDNKRIRAERIVPIVTRDTLKEGIDATVERIIIHGQYNRLSPDRNDSQPHNNTFILKSYAEDKSHMYQNEIYAYQMLKDDQIASNVVQCLGSWMQNHRYCILLEYVGGGTLSDLLNTNQPTSSEDRLRFWTRLLRILDVICWTHRHPDPEDNTRVVQGVHQDIKPDNILVTTSESLFLAFDNDFKIVDLALAYFESSPQGNLRTHHIDGRGTQMFSAPECFRDERDSIHDGSAQQAQPSKDVWSLGCVFTLVLIWSVLGPGGVATYKARLGARTEEIPELRATAYIGCFHDGNTLLDVVPWMHIAVLKSCSAGDQIIQSLVPIIEAMLDDIDSRPDIFEVRKRCRKALTRARDMFDTSFPGPFQTSNGKNDRAPTPPQTPPKIPLDSSDARGLGVNYGEGSASHRDSPSRALSSSSTSTNKDFHGHKHNTSIDDVISQPSSPTSVYGTKFHGNTQSSLQGIASLGITSPDISSIENLSRMEGLGNSHQTPTNVHRASTNGIAGQSKNMNGVRKKPFTTIDQVHSWIDQKKRFRGKIPPSPVPDHEIHSLNGRDQIFIVDNSDSMKAYSNEVYRTLGSLGYLVKHFDPDGIELYFTRDSQHARDKDRERLLMLLSNVRYQGSGGMEVILGKILDRYVEPRTRSSLFKKKKAVEASIYVLTDGYWGNDDYTLQDMPELIRRTALHMNTRMKIGIQFIQFGHHPAGTWRLRELDDHWKKHGMELDMIDTTPYDGNVFKMLLGSFDPTWDNEPPSTVPSPTIEDQPS